jgi:predicted permease
MKIWTRLRMWRQRRRFEEDLAEEVRIHRQMAAEYSSGGGEGRQFGPEALAMENSRAVWGFAWWDSLRQDVRYAVRGIRKSPGFALTVIGTIGLGLGLNTTTFTVFDAYVLKTLAVRDPHSLYQVWWASPGADWRAPWQQYQDLRQQSTVFSDVLATEVLIAPVDGRLGVGHLVSGNYFTMLQPGVTMGRLLQPDDAAVQGAGSVMVLSYAAWKNWYAGDPGIVGRKLILRGQPFEVVGVAGPSFAGLGSVALDFWIPLSMSPRVMDGPDLFGGAQPHMLRLTARLRPGVRPEAARSALWTWAVSSTANLPQESRVTMVEMVSSATAIALSAQTLAEFAPIFVAFGLVLVISCANVSNMMLARALARQREIGIRVSLGAGRARLIRQLLTESLLLAVPAAAVGMVLSQVTIGFAQWLLMATLPPAFSKIVRVPELHPDTQVFAFILAASVAATLVFGLIPAIQTTRSSLVQANRGDFSNDHRPSRLRNVLVAGQVTVCSLLLICAGIILRSQQRVIALDIGMSTRGVFDVQAAGKYKTQVWTVLASQPGVAGMATAWRPPLYNVLPRLAVDPSNSRNEYLAGYNFVSPEYFSVLRIPLLRGRIFTQEEARAGSGVAIISEATARLFWPGRDALGETIAIPTHPLREQRTQRIPRFVEARVIGIMRDTASGFVGDGLDSTCIYFPTSGTVDNASLLVRMSGDKEGGRRILEKSLNGLADQINPMDEVLATMIYPFRIAFWVTGFLAGLAMVLTVSGIYGVLSYLVSQRSKEIGIRMALGASAATVVRLVVTQSMRLAVAGTVVGALAALAVAPVFANQLQLVKPYDALVYVAGAGLVGLASLAAACMPCRRAVRIDPVITLRFD